MHDGVSPFVEDAGHSADRARIIWSAPVDPNVLTVTATPALPHKSGALDLHEFGSAASVVGGPLDLSRYEASQLLQSSLIVDGWDMTTEAALTKLMWVCARAQDFESRQRLLVQNLAGEISGQSGRGEHAKPADSE